MKNEEPIDFQTESARVGINDAGALYSSGVKYLTGDGVPKNGLQANDYFIQAAELGHAVAAVRLGFNYYNGIGARKNIWKAWAWFALAAEQGNAAAQFYVGLIYALGNVIVSKDPEKANYWTAKAAEQGHADAQTLLGMFYYMGDGVPIDPKKADYWLTKASGQGEAVARALQSGASAKKLAQMIKKDNYGRRVPNGPEKIDYWLNEAAEQGDKDARAILGMHFVETDGFSKEPKMPVNEDSAGSGQLLNHIRRSGKMRHPTLAAMHKFLTGSPMFKEVKLRDNNEISIVTGCEYEDGTAIILYLINKDGEFVLTDCGRTRNYMDKHFELKADEVIKVILAITKHYGISVAGQQLSLKIRSLDDYADGIFKMVYCIGFLDNMKHYFT